MKRIIILCSAFLLTFTTLSQSIVMAQEDSYEQYEEQKIKETEKELETMSDEKLNREIDESAKAFDDLMQSGAIQLDGCGNIAHINVDLLEEKFGVTTESIELRRLISENPLPSGKSACGIMTRGHIENFSNCFLK